MEKITASAKSQRRRDGVFWVAVVGGVDGDGGGGTGAVKLPRDSGRAGEIPTWRALLLALYKRCQAGSANPPRDATSYSCMFYILLCGCVDCRCRTSGGEKVTPAVGVDASCLLCNAATLQFAALLRGCCRARRTALSQRKNNKKKKSKHISMTRGRFHTLSFHHSRPGSFFCCCCCLLVCFPTECINS